MNETFQLALNAAIAWARTHNRMVVIRGATRGDAHRWGHETSDQWPAWYDWLGNASDPFAVPHPMDMLMLTPDAVRALASGRHRP